MRDGITAADRATDDREDCRPGPDCEPADACAGVGSAVGGEVSRVIEFPVPREKIVGLQDALFDGIKSGALVDTVNDQPLEHNFIPGAYARSMLILKGTLIIGKIHRNPCFNFIMTGRCTVFSEDGIKRIVAPFFFVSQPGAKRVVLADPDGDVLWVTCHGTTKTDLVEIEQELIAPTYDDLLPKSFVDHMKENGQ